jgi:hypothetical protein
VPAAGSRHDRTVIYYRWYGIIRTQVGTQWVWYFATLPRHTYFLSGQRIWWRFVYYYFGQKNLFEYCLLSIRFLRHVVHIFYTLIIFYETNHSSNLQSNVHRAAWCVFEQKVRHRSVKLDRTQPTWQNFCLANILKRRPHIHAKKERLLPAALTTDTKPYLHHFFRVLSQTLRIHMVKNYCTVLLRPRCVHSCH